MTALSETKRYQAYPEYKDSGVEWLDDIPKDWCTRRLKHMLESPMSYGANEAAERAVSTEPRYIRITDMNSDGTLKEDTFRSLPRDIASDYLLKDRDILLARSGATVGKSFIYRKEFGDCCFAGYLIKVSCDSARLNSDYAFWFFQSSSYWQYISGSQIQATIQNVSAEKYGEMYISLPEHVEEQTQIANFLDHETAKIDTLIEKQQQLIKLLKEKRQAVISHAVTKGLNPQAPMKDSGVEWLGEVPEHWGVSQLKYDVNPNTSITYGIVQAGPHIEDGIPYIKTSDMSGDELPLDGYSKTSVRIDAAYKRSKVFEGDIVVAIRASVGKSLLVPKNLDGANLTQGTAKISCGLNMLPKFLLAYLNSVPVQGFFSSISKGATFKEITLDSLRRLPTLVPPLPEQEKLAQYIGNHNDIFMKLIKSAEIQVSLLKERRVALISAAVTGKIDVRNWQAPTHQDQALEQTA